MQNTEHNAVSTRTDVGPYLLGVPSAGRRPLTAEERIELRRYLLRRSAALAALLLPIPIGCLLLPLFNYSGEHNMLPICGIFDCAIMAGIVVTAVIPAWRTFLTFQDYHDGMLETCVGQYSEKDYKPNPSASIADSKLEQDIVRRITDAKSDSSVLKRLPRSGRIWAVNGEILPHWFTTNWQGIAKSVDVEQLSPELQAANQWHFVDDIAIGMPFFAIFVTVIVYNIWSPPWYELLLAFVSTMFVGHQTMCLYTAITAAKRK